MGQLIEALWRSSDTGEVTPFQSWVPDPIAALRFTPSIAQQERLSDCTALMSEHIADIAWAEAAAFVATAEAVASSMIERVYASPRQSMIAAAAGAWRDNEKMVLANVDAISASIAVGGNGSRFDVSMFETIHRALTTQLPRYGHRPGALRDTQVWIGRAPIFDVISNRLGPAGPQVIYVPPPPQMVAPLLDDLAAFCNRDDLHPVVQAAVAHARFEEIHPFPDGNGRVGRAMCFALWTKRSLTPGGVVVPISATIADWGASYIAALKSFQSVAPLDDNLTAVAPIVNLMSDAFRRAVTHATSLVRRLSDRQRCWQQALFFRRNSLGAAVLADVIRRPVFTADDIASAYGASARQTHRVVSTLLKSGVIATQNPGRKKPIYASSPLLDDLLEAFRSMVGQAYDSRIEDETWRTDVSRSPQDVADWLDAQRKQPPCAAFMPRAQLPCVLPLGHSGRHRSKRR